MTYQTGDSPSDIVEDPDCPHERIAGDIDSSREVCDLNGKICVRFTGYECETYEEFLDEEEQQVQ